MAVPLPPGQTLTMSPILITEILRPAEQGRSGPFVCRGEDDHVYFVKGRNTGRASQIAEWLCGHLGRALGLPLAPFAQVEILPALLRETVPEWRGIGSGLAFGSREYPKALWLEAQHVAAVPVDLQRDVLVFDWWIRNGDRLLTNSNLLWDAVKQQLVVIDHNLAFDPDFTPRDFLAYHVFREQADHIFGDLMEQASYQQRLLEALSAWDQAVGSIPAEWWWVDDEQTVPAAFDLTAAQAALQLCDSSDFWRRP